MDRTSSLVRALSTRAYPLDLPKRNEHTGQTGTDAALFPAFADCRQHALNRRLLPEKGCFWIEAKTTANGLTYQKLGTPAISFSTHRISWNLGAADEPTQDNSAVTYC